MILTSDDVEDIIRILDSSFYDELHIKTDKFDLRLRRSPSGWTQETHTLSAPHTIGGAKAEAAPKIEGAKASEPAEAEVAGVTAVRAPMVGTFYRAPKPGAAPFVDVGAEVGEYTVISIIETMKLMNSISAGAVGTVIEICVQDGQLVEAQQVLMRIRRSDK
jgi:acetyl-CoA carboxylase biotin carboxyl carrier protein